MTTDDPPPAVSLREAVRVWGYIGVNSFGGPAGQIAVMHREVVDRRRWLSERRFVHALNYCMLLPGPEAQQLATYVGWLMHGVRGGLVAGVLFVVPGFLVMMALSLLYALFGDVGWVAGLLFGLQAAVVAIVLQALLRVSRRLLLSTAAVVLAVGAFVALFFLGIPFPVVVVSAGAVGWVIGRTRPQWFASAQPAAEEGGEAVTYVIADDETVPRQSARRALRAAACCAALWLTVAAALVVGLGTDHVFAQEAILFSQTAVIGFGGAYAILTYVSQEAVGEYAWLSPQDMTTGLALAETTPGPLVLVLQFVGFMAGYNHPGGLPPLVAGCIGAVIAVWMTFLPCFMFIFAGAPFVEQLRHSASLRYALSAIGAAVVGVIANLALWFSFTTLFHVTHAFAWGPVTVYVPVPGSLNVPAVAIALGAALLIWGARWPTLRVLAVCAAAGTALAVLGLT